ncbi:MAG: MBOAT family protein [Bacteroidales bacterium]|nr:MBOAT family protein [Bacteroidales bacterium]
MAFNSLEFLIFLPVVVGLYYSLNPRYRWILLLAASYFFYMWWNPLYIILIITSTAIDYFAARAIEKTPLKKKKRKYLLLSLFTNLGLLFSFKYYGFFAGSMQRLLSLAGIEIHFPYLDILLPVGISFYTFQTLSYTIDVYKGKIKAEKHPGYFALYVTYFPQLVAGPIERFDRLSPQLKATFRPTYENFSNGFRLILFGLFTKMVIADNLAPYVEKIYEGYAAYSTTSIVIGLIFYSFQIYADFYGYSTIAVGSALLMGVQLMDNFRTPYLSRNISEFWKRWHISLSTWFRDYVYIPLGGNRVSWLRWALNVFVVFTLSGLWHGANWTFVIWGSIFGIMFLIERIFQEKFHWITPERWNWLRLAGVIKTFIIVTLAWIFFRSPSVRQALDLFKHLYLNLHLQNTLAPDTYVTIWLGLFIISDIWLFNSRFDQRMARLPLIARWLFYAILIFAITGFGGTDNQPFIYFQF